MRKLDVAWAAGFLEGEGSFYSSLRKRRRRGKVELRGEWVIKTQSVDLEPLERLKSIFAGSICGPYPSRGLGKKKYWIWTLSGKASTRAALVELYDWLSPRRKRQADRLYLDKVDMVGR